MAYILYTISFTQNFFLNYQNMASSVQIITSIFTNKNTSSDVFTMGSFPAFSNPENSALSTKLLLSF